MQDKYKPSDELTSRLASATPAPGDFVAYCPTCGDIGIPNAVWAFNKCQQCKNSGVRVWKNTQPVAKGIAVAEEVKE